ncbi:MAG TPA: hypothetical protein VJY39_04430 [Acidisphaera sp.]|nr:hypothetical protein [Acidisphaera sp.]
MEVAQAGAAALDLAAEMACVGAHEVAFDRAPVAMVPGFERAAMGDHRPELGLELRRHGLGAVAGDVFAVARPELPSLLAVFPPLGEQAHGAASGELEERDLGLPVGFVAGGDVVGVCPFAVVAARLAASGPGVGRVAPRGEVAAPRVGAEQLAGRRPVFAEGVVGDLEPVVPGLAGAWRLVVRRQRTGACLARVRTRGHETFVEALERGREPAQQAARVVGRGRGRAASGLRGLWGLRFRRGRGRAGRVRCWPA